MELWIMYLVYYLCVAVSLGISSSIVVLKAANKLAKELTLEPTTVDKYPIISYITWIVTASVLFPWIVIKTFTVNYEEEIPSLAARLVAGKG